MVTEQQKILDVKNLVVDYTASTGTVRAVDQVSFGLHAGECVGIIGESGSGKSSLVSAIMGLIKQGTTQGEIRYRDIDLNALTEKQLRRYRWKEMALVFQNSLDVLNPVLTVGEQIEEPLRLHDGGTPHAREQRVIELLEMVELDPHWRKVHPHQLSGGMRQKALFAMALACHPNILLVDEPTASLDPESRQEIISLLMRLQHQEHCAMLLISHDLPLIKKLTGRLMVMYAGQFLETGMTPQVLKEPAHCYTRGLLQASPNFFKYKDLWGIEGEPPRSAAQTGCAFAPRCCQAEASCMTSRPVLTPVRQHRMVACHKSGIETFLQAANITKTYRSADRTVPAVKDVAIEVKSGETVALLGKTGSGKSTLAHVLAGVLRSDEGDVYYRRKKVEGRWATSMIGGMQIVFQDPFSSTSPRMTVLDVVREPLDIIRWQDADQRREAACQMLRTVQLPVTEEFLASYCYALSGGQRQRVAIARALSTQPKLLIADEITAMLDTSTQANILRQLQTLQKTRGFAMLYITHDFHIARKIADSVYVLRDGECVEHGVATDIFETPRHVYTKNLLQAAFHDFA
jgi:peptide/nickel transport system ATP-binding protein